MQLCGRKLSSSWDSCWIFLIFEWEMDDASLFSSSGSSLWLSHSSLSDFDGRQRDSYPTIGPLATFPFLLFTSQEEDSPPPPLEKTLKMREGERGDRERGGVMESLKKSKIICVSSWNVLTSAVGNGVTIYHNVHLLLSFDKYFHLAVWACLDGSVPNIFINLILMDTWKKYRY